MNPGVYSLVGAIVATIWSGRLSGPAPSGLATLEHWSRLAHGKAPRRSSGVSRLLLVLGLALWIVTAFLLPPVAWLNQLSLADWATTLLRLLGALVLGLALFKLLFALSRI